jgi:hypothetical protein
VRLEVCTPVTVEIAERLEILTISTGDCSEIRDSDDGDWRFL